LTQHFSPNQVEMIAPIPAVSEIADPQLRIPSGLRGHEICSQCRQTGARHGYVEAKRRSPIERLWQNATYCDIMRHMAKSVRVSDTLYELADSVSASAHRSLAQQIEYWAALGRAVEAAGVTTSQVQQILEGSLRARERALLELGLTDPQSMYLFPVAVAQKTKVHFPELEEQ